MPSSCRHNNNNKARLVLPIKVKWRFLTILLLSSYAFLRTEFDFVLSAVEDNLVLPMTGNKTFYNKDNVTNMNLNTSGMSYALTEGTSFVSATDYDYNKKRTNHTIVTAFYRTDSKYTSERYDEWMATMLSLQDAMVIYTSPDLVSKMRKLRSHALDKTVVFAMELEDLPLAIIYQKDFWQGELDRDPEKKRHKSYQLFWIWLSKTWFVSRAVNDNPFNSSIFVWSDIGCFRGQARNYQNKELVLHPDLIPRHSILQMAHNKPKVPSTVWWNDKLSQPQHFYHSGTQAAGYGDTWLVYHEKVAETIQGFVERNMFVGEDQVVLQSTCLRYPHLCEYIPYDQVKDNNYYGLRHVLHYGGNFTTWRPPKREMDAEDALITRETPQHH